MAQIKADYNSGKLLTGEVRFLIERFRSRTLTLAQLKAMCIKYLQEYVAEFQERRSKVNDEVVDKFMAVRPLEWQGNPKVPRADIVVPTTKPSDEAAGDGKMSKNEQKRILKEQQLAARKAEKAAAKAAAKEGAAQ